jgi:AcrR family transcriptional regulator
MKRIVKKPEVRKQEIVKAACSLFQAKEYQEVTMQDVMQSVGVAKGTIYHYFKSKKELWIAVIDDIVSESLVEMKELVEGVKGSALDKIRKLIEKGSIAKKNSTLLDQLHQPGNEAMHVRLLVATLEKQAQLYGQIIQQGCKEKVFKTCNPLECAEFILTAVQFLTDMGIHPWTEDELQRRGRAFPGIIQQLLMAPKGSFDFMIPIK